MNVYQNRYLVLIGGETTPDPVSEKQKSAKKVEENLSGS